MGRLDGDRLPDGSFREARLPPPNKRLQFGRPIASFHGTKTFRQDARKRDGLPVPHASLAQIDDEARCLIIMRRSPSRSAQPECVRRWRGRELFGATASFVESTALALCGCRSALLLRSTFQMQNLMCKAVTGINAFV